MQQNCPVTKRLAVWRADGQALISPGSRDMVHERYCSFAYSVLASLRMGMFGSASFQSVRKSL